MQMGKFTCCDCGGKKNPAITPKLRNSETEMRIIHIKDPTVASSTVMGYNKCIQMRGGNRKYFISKAAIDLSVKRVKMI